jgi:hypothetical protein
MACRDAALRRQARTPQTKETVQVSAVSLARRKNQKAFFISSIFNLFLPSSEFRGQRRRPGPVARGARLVATNEFCRYPARDCGLTRK